MFGRDHSKVSLKLRQMVAHDASQYEIVRAIPDWYYPRLDCVHGRNFVVRYLETYQDTDLIDTFVARGMDLNSRVNDNNDTLLHVLMEKPYAWHTAISELVETFSEIDVTLTNHDGQTPMDVFLANASWHQVERFVGKMLEREMQKYYPNAPGVESQRYLRQRFAQLAQHLRENDVKRLIPEQLPLSLRDDNGRTVFMDIVEHCPLNVARELVRTKGFSLPDHTEPVVDMLISREGARAQDTVSTLIELHSARVSGKTLELAAKTTNLEFINYIFGVIHPRRTDAALDAARAMFAVILKNGDVDFAIKAAASRTFKDVADLDAAIDDQGATLLLTAIARGRATEVQALLDAGADIRKHDGSGQHARALALESRNKQTVAIVEDTLRRLNQRGDFERVHDNQIAYKNGVLTYIFDFYAGQVVVRDNDTKNIAATPFADFAKSGSHLLGEAASNLTALGGNTNGFGAANSLSPDVVRKPASPIGKKPAA